MDLPAGSSAREVMASVARGGTPHKGWLNVDRSDFPRLRAEAPATGGVASTTRIQRSVGRPAALSRHRRVDARGGAGADPAADHRDAPTSSARSTRRFE
ncbi:hypothetical protein GCM10022227_20430 [Streptomyces sedi]